MHRAACWQILVPLALGVALAANACSGPAATSTPNATPTPRVARDSGANGVTVMAVLTETSYLSSKGHPSDHWGFTVQLDTHSGDLMAANLASSAVLKDGNGNELRPASWQDLSADSHHRSGLLIFAGTKPEGSLILVLSNVAGVPERVLRWD